ncbi:NAD(P)/FAD-dependent oxidoreductase [Youngiibacter multivorans]|uniref:NADPH-dependent 2,4-dienoyl-CoA reductase/sulfur reductase-like enzyme n=1 Tax=Youngiibacter multivorans TaxID=937251 RepID=A0ABS4G313_9CLOT|nr:FAD-dependent oxidoreductase [Youngiibacter multivorans]MBP1918872.1 NADPH-dependent 2,4-dienoyl-CoA reductase/sulfur reductase-like enzyme [Youngiibacter multivorans]
MKSRKVDVLIIGGGPAGLAAAAALHGMGITDLLLVEREDELGGILRQCIHEGFGLKRFKTSLSGPEYAARFVRRLNELGIEHICGAAVTDMTEDKRCTVVSRDGLMEITARAVILAMGCRERTRGAIAIPGSRPSGVMTAGVAQSYMNIHNKQVGKEVVILGSGDIGLIMARRLTLEGSSVLGVYELQPYASGLPRNISQCLEDYDIPLHLSRTVSRIHGRDRLEGITVMAVDDKLVPVKGTEEFISCDTLILSVGLIPENELSLAAGVVLDPRTKGPVISEAYETSVPGIFAAGNVLQVHDLVDQVSMEAERLAEGVANYLEGKKSDLGFAGMKSGAYVSYVVPQWVAMNEDKEITVSLRVKEPLRNRMLHVMQEGVSVFSRKISHAIPAEMIQFQLPAESVKSTGDMEVMIS